MISIGQTVYFSIPESKKNYYVDWFVYAAKHRIPAKVVSILGENLRIECKFIKLEGTLKTLKNGGPTIYTDYENAVPVSLYEEV